MLSFNEKNTVVQHAWVNNALVEHSDYNGAKTVNPLKMTVRPAPHASAS